MVQLQLYSAGAPLSRKARYVEDPYGFVMAAFPWDVAGKELENETGPDENQIVFLLDLGEEVKLRGFNGIDPVMPILMTATSGHGTASPTSPTAARLPKVFR